ncbi:MAG TPA: hypothetical protein GXX17_07245 [Clostridiales bacterium]|nr:hypothetical protein [Clostridiales bacterium]
MHDNIDRDKLMDMIDKVSDKLGADTDQLKDAVRQGKIDNILNNLSASDSQKIKQILSDKAAVNRLLSTPQAQMLLKKLLKDKDN